MQKAIQIKTSQQPTLAEIEERMRKVIGEELEVRLKQPEAKPKTEQKKENPLKKPYDSWVEKIQQDKQYFDKRIAELQQAMSALESALSEKKHGKYLLKLFTKPSKWSMLVFHPISAYRGSATATRRAIMALKAELARMQALRGSWLALCDAELENIARYYKRIYTQEPTNKEVSALKEYITAMSQRHFELRNLTMTAIFGEHYRKTFEKIFTYQGTLTPNAAISRLARRKPVEYVKKTLSAAVSELKKEKTK